MSSPWNPDQYHKFQNERSQPFFDLLSMVQPAPGGRAIDLGCGTGELTRILHDTVGAKATIGLDNSETMLEKAATVAGSGLTFKLGTILRFAPRKQYDILFSNAALQWVTGHEALFPRLMAAVAPGGQLAIQMPMNADHPSHVTAFELAREEPWKTALDGYFRPWPVMPPEWYAELLDAQGFAEQNVRQQVYGHHLGGRADVIEWVKGTLLTDYERRMDPAIWPDFLAAYRERLLPRLADTHPYFYAFKRVLIWGRKAK